MSARIGTPAQRRELLRWLLLALLSAAFFSTAGLVAGLIVGVMG